MKLPSVLGLVLCEELGRDPQTGKPSLRGVFNSWHFPIFPTPLQQFTVYVALYDGVGEGKLALELMRLETEEVVYSNQRWILLPGRMKPLFLELKVTRCLFTGPGRYWLRLFFDEQLISDRYVEVFRE